MINKKKIFEIVYSSVTRNNNIKVHGPNRFLTKAKIQQFSARYDKNRIFKISIFETEFVSICAKAGSFTKKLKELPTCTAMSNTVVYLIL